MASDPANLIERASSGDAQAVEALLRRHLPGVEGFVARNVGARVRAKESVADLVQSTCRELIERLRDGRFRFRGEAEFKQWLYRAALMKLMNRDRHWLAAGRQAVQPTPDAARRDTSRADSGAWAVNLTTPSEEAAFQEELARFERAFAELPEKHREVIFLFHVEGLSHAEIAARKGISESYSRALLARALARLARCGATSNM